MDKLLPNVPKGCKITGYVFDDANKKILLADMLKVELPNKILICVGWFPECNSNGSYKVEAIYNLNKLLVQKTYDAHKAINIVEQFIKDLIKVKKKK